MKAKLLKMTLRLVLCLLVGTVYLAMTYRPVRADVLEDFAGYTRPGWPPSGQELPSDVRPVDFPKDGSIGGSVYFKVFERGEVENIGDPWNTGIKDVGHSFVAGKEPLGNTPSPRLDTSARYLYLYQTVNDSKRDSKVRMSTVRLLIEPEYITSWGWFAGRKVDKKGEGITGISFTEELGGKIQPASNGLIDVDKRKYHNPSPPYPPPPGFGLTSVPIWMNRPAAAAAKENTVIEPEQVMLLASVNFEGRPYPTTGRIMVPYFGELSDFWFPPGTLRRPRSAATVTSTSTRRWVELYLRGKRPTTSISARRPCAPTGWTSRSNRGRAVVAGASPPISRRPTGRSG